MNVVRIAKSDIFVEFPGNVFPKKGVPLWLHLFPGVESFWKQGKEIGIQGGFKREDD